VNTEENAMTIDAIRDRIPDYARDIRLNLGSVLTQGAPGLNEAQVWMTALASAIAARNATVVAAVERAASQKLDAAQLNAARTAAALMGMNNVYYRFTHLVEDDEYAKLPARLRMNAMANPGIDRLDFELVSLAVSAINGCGRCVVAHERQLNGHGFTREAVQSAVRIAAVIHAAAGVLDYEEGRGAIAAAA